MDGALGSIVTACAAAFHIGDIIIARRKPKASAPPSPPFNDLGSDV
jgi:hypothetical protein